MRLWLLYTVMNKHLINPIANFRYPMYLSASVLYNEICITSHIMAVANATALCPTLVSSQRNNKSYVIKKNIRNFLSRVWYWEIAYLFCKGPWLR